MNKMISKDAKSEGMPPPKVQAEKLINLDMPFFFGVDSQTPANNLLQNNIDLFEWVTRNKVYPLFWGRYIIGENCLTKEETEYLQDKKCKIIPICYTSELMDSKAQGELFAMKMILLVKELGIPLKTAIFLEVEEQKDISKEYMHGFCKVVLDEGYIPGFKANTDAKYSFDREFSRGMQSHKEIFDKCMLWAISLRSPEFEGITTTHLVYPETWNPFTPSCLKRSEIDLWQYGGNCHPIYDDKNYLVSFNISILINWDIISGNMY